MGTPHNRIENLMMKSTDADLIYSDYSSEHLEDLA